VRLHEERVEGVQRLIRSPYLQEQNDGRLAGLNGEPKGRILTGCWVGILRICLG
jgi:hypothetical protein